MFFVNKLFRVFWVALNNLYVIPAYFVWLILLRPILWINPKLYWQIEDRFFGWLLTMVACWNYTAGKYRENSMAP
jgi:lysophosphatidylglycerol acyltransferase 1